MASLAKVCCYSKKNNKIISKVFRKIRAKFKMFFHLKKKETKTKILTQKRTSMLITVISQIAGRNLLLQMTSKQQLTYENLCYALYSRDFYENGCSLQRSCYCFNLVNNKTLLNCTSFHLLPIFFGIYICFENEGNNFENSAIANVVPEMSI